MKFEFGIAMRHLRAHKSRGLSLVAWLSLLGVATGVAALVGGFSVTSGFNVAFAERLLGMTAHVTVRHPVAYRAIMREAEGVPGVVADPVPGGVRGHRG